MTLHAHLGEAVAVYPRLEPGYTLIVSDGAYGIGGFPGDPTSPRQLADWYAPHLAAWDRLAAPSSSLYLWGTPEGCARLLPAVEAAGWTLRSQIRWDKGFSFLAGRIDTEKLRGWPCASEDCYFYVRESVDISALAAGETYRDIDAKARDSAAPVLMRVDRGAAGISRRQMAEFFPSRTGGLTGCVTNWEEGFNFPTWEVWVAFAAGLQALAPRPADARPYLVTEAVWTARNGADPLRASYDPLRVSYEALRYPFALPRGATDVWTGAPVVGPRRHPCAKRQEHVDRIVLTSSRPGDRVLEPFGGGAPVLRACRRLGRSCDSIERDPEWHAVARAILGEHAAVDEPDALPGQGRLWG